MQFKRLTDIISILNHSIYSWNGLEFERGKKERNKQKNNKQILWKKRNDLVLNTYCYYKTESNTILQ